MGNGWSRNWGRIHRHPVGASLVESLVGIMILVPVLLLIFACAEIFCAEEYNCRTCRDAARQAASVCPAPTDRNGPLSENSPAFRAANRVIGKNTVSKPSEQSMFSDVELVEVSMQGLKVQSGENVEGPINGYVSVKTAITVKLPISCGAVLPANLRLVSAYSFPITATVSATTPTSPATIPRVQYPAKTNVPRVQVNVFQGNQR